MVQGYFLPHILHIVHIVIFTNPLIYETIILLKGISYTF